MIHHYNDVELRLPKCSQLHDQIVSDLACNLNGAQRQHDMPKSALASDSRTQYAAKAIYATSRRLRHVSRTQTAATYYFDQSAREHLARRLHIHVKPAVVCVDEQQQLN